MGLAQVTRFELDQQKEREKREAAAKAQQTMNSRELLEDQYNQLVDGEVNVVDGVDAHNVDEAVAQLTVTEYALSSSSVLAICCACTNMHHWPAIHLHSADASMASVCVCMTLHVP